MIRDTIPAEEALRKAQSVGQYYGFNSFSALASGKRSAGAKAPYPDQIPFDSLDPVTQSVAGFLKQVRDAGLAPGLRAPLFLWHSNITAGRTAPKHAVVQFHAIGADRAIADAVLIRAMSALVADYYHATPEVRLNSMGDRETRARYAKELTAFFKKRGGSLPEECLTCAKRDVFEAAELAITKECAEDLPSPTDHLSDQSRKRFEELLEYLEATNTAYTLAPSLLSRGPFWGETCFEIRLPAQGDATHGRTAAWGSRYHELAKPFFKMAMPATGAVLKIETEGGSVAGAKRPAKVRVAFVHIGDEAKRASITLAEDLRRAHVPLSQMIGVESLTEQMRLAEAINPPYLLIMGRKEALEHTAILRNRTTHEETVLPFSKLADKLKAIA